MILLHNKIDLHQKENNFDEIVRDELNQNYTTTILQLSAKDQTGIEALKAELISFVDNLKTEESNTVITNQRHFEALQKSLDFCY